MRPRATPSPFPAGTLFPLQFGGSWRQTLSLLFLPPSNGLVSCKLSPHPLHLTRSLRKTYDFKELESFPRMEKAIFPVRFSIGQGLRSKWGLLESSYSSLDSVFFSVCKMMPAHTGFSELTTDCLAHGSGFRNSKGLMLSWRWLPI